MREIRLEQWSERYMLAPNVQVDTYDGDLALMDEDLWEMVHEILGPPVYGHVDGIHYHFEPTRSVMSHRVAVPKDNHRVIENPQLLLCQ